MSELDKRVTYDAGEVVLANTVGDALAEITLPGVFASGKKVIGSKNSRENNQISITLCFDDGSDMTFIGDFEVRANAPQTRPT